MRQRITSVKINDSLNPMHYIRDDDDIQIYINNLLKDFPEKDAVTKSVIQLTHIILQYLIYTHPSDSWTPLAVAKILNAIKVDDRDDMGPFDVLFTDLSVRTNENAQNTYRNYMVFKNLCKTDKTIDLSAVVEMTRKLAVERAQKASTQLLRQHLIKPNIPLQATVKISTGTTYLLYFINNSSNQISVSHVICRSDNCISAIVSAIHPFLYNFEKKATLDKKFLRHVIDLSNEALEKQNVKLDWVIETAFKDDFGDSLDEILEYDPNRSYKLSSKDDTGIHEAGHAVLAWLFDNEIEHATIVRDRQEWYGHVTYCSLNEKLPAGQRRLISIFKDYAGDLASKDRSQYSYWRRKASTDVETATDSAKAYVSKNVLTLDHWFIDYDALGVPKTFWVAYKTSLLCEYVYNRTAEIVNANRDLIDALAEELCKKKTMTGAEIDACLSTIDPSRKGSLLAILPEEERTINAILNPYQPAKPENEPSRQ